MWSCRRYESVKSSVPISALTVPAFVNAGLMRVVPLPADFWNVPLFWMLLLPMRIRPELPTLLRGGALTSPKITTCAIG